MAKHQAAPVAERVSVTALLFPLVSVLYFEAVFSYFARTGMTVYKVLFALSAGAFGLALSRLTPSRVLNFLLQSAWLLFCGGLAAAQYLCFAATGAFSALPNQPRLSPLPCAVNHSPASAQEGFAASCRIFPDSA